MAIKQCMCTILCLLSVLLAFSQQMVSGRVLDANTGHPLPSISVYLDNTSIGTTTNSKGEFFIGHIPPAKYKLVASGISYKTFSKLIDTHDTIGYMTIQLTSQADLLQGTVVKAPDPDGWKNWGQLFTNVFVGTSPFAQDCIILNQEVLKFRLNDDNTLTVYAEKPIHLHNRALGYDITYDLEELTYSFYSGVVGYSGHIFFKDLSLGRSGRRALTWRHNRLETYNGSILQFMRAIYANTLPAQGFEMHSLAKVPNRDKQRAKQLFSRQKRILDTISSEPADSNGLIGYKYVIFDSTDFYKNALLQPDSIISHAPISADSVGFAADSTTAGFYFPDSLEVSYNLKEAPGAYRRLSPATRKEAHPVSQLVFINKWPVYVLRNGFYYNGSDLKMTGYWSWSETVGTFLPYDYEPGQ